MKANDLLKQFRILFPYLCISVLSVVPFFPSLAADSPLLIPFQGRLTDQQGVEYSGGQYTLTFRLYDQAVGGTPIWTETHNNVGTINGMVNVFLGSITSLSNVNFAVQKHLGITIDVDGNPNTADPEMVPRQMIIPTFSAKNSEKLDSYDWENPPASPLFVPVGGVIMWWGDKAAIPAGYEVCDGGVPTTPGALISDKPDLRDKFVKGAVNTDTLKGHLGSGGQHSLNLSHTHTVPGFTINADGNFVGMLGARNSDGVMVFRSYDLTPGVDEDDGPQRFEPSSGNITSAGIPAGNRTGVPEGLRIKGTWVKAAEPSGNASGGDISGSTDNRPAYQELFYIIRVK